MNIKFSVWMKWVVKHFLKSAVWLTYTIANCLEKCNQAWAEDKQEGNENIPARVVVELAEQPQREVAPPVEDPWERPMPRTDTSVITTDTTDHPPQAPQVQRAENNLAVNVRPCNERPHQMYRDFRLNDPPRTYPICPLCDRTMKVRRSGYGFFLGCSAHPKCKGHRAPDGSRPGPAAEINQLKLSLGLAMYERIEESKRAGKVPLLP